MEDVCTKESLIPDGTKTDTALRRPKRTLPIKKSNGDPRIATAFDVMSHMCNGAILAMYMEIM